MGLIQANYSLTPNGNTYQKSTIGQNIGFVASTMGPASALAASIPKAYKGFKNNDKKTGLIFTGISVALIGLTALCGHLGKKLGAKLDNSLNKDNATEADNKAKLNQQA